MTVAGKVLREAAEIVDGARAATHGDKERSFVGIATLWQNYLDQRMSQCGGELILSGTDVCWMMVLLKIARSIYGDCIKDHFADAAGYSAIAWECAPGRSD